MEGRWMVPCLVCGVMHGVKTDGTTDHRCADPAALAPAIPACSDHSAHAPGQEVDIREAEDIPAQPTNISLWLQEWLKDNQDKEERHSMGKRQNSNAMDLSAVNLALGLTAEGEGTMSLSQNHSLNAYLDNVSSGMQRQAPSPISPQQPMNTNAANGGNGGGGMNGMGVGMPMSAGQQMDINFLYQKLTELGEVLKDNREKTQGIVASAEELATRAASHGAGPSLQEANQGINAARIADLTRQLTRSQQDVRVLLREQRENTKLIGEFETGIGTVVELLRNYVYAQNSEKHRLAREYNKLLQDEKDAHLESRLEKDDWMAKAHSYMGMMRHAYRLACEDHDPVVRVVAGLQNEVRGYRNALGMEPEKFEDEFGYEILKEVKNGAGEP